MTVEHIDADQRRSYPQIKYASPSRLIEVPLASFVSRSIWPDKPIQLTMYDLGQEYYDQQVTAYTASSITPIDGLFRYGGWIPMSVGMFVLDCGARVLECVLDIQHNSHAILLVLLLFSTVVVAECEWVAIFSGIPLTVLAWVGSAALIFRRRSAS